MKSKAQSVPSIYLGAWRRDYIRRANGDFDNTTECWWLQSPRYHIDLRVPVDRPRVSKVHVLDAIDDEAKQRYSRQTAWVGVTEVEGDRCQWSPIAAIPELSSEPDIGLMEFKTEDELIETCPEGRYVERWLRASRANQRCVSVRLEAVGSINARLTVIFLDDAAGLAMESAGTLAEVQIAKPTAQDGWRVVRASAPLSESLDWPADIEQRLTESYLRMTTGGYHDAIIDWKLNDITSWRISAMEYN